MKQKELDENGECWLGKDCPNCKGTGVQTDKDNEERKCQACAGTGETYGKPE